MGGPFVLDVAAFALGMHGGTMCTFEDPIADGAAARPACGRRSFGSPELTAHPPAAGALGGYDAAVGRLPLGSPTRGGSVLVRPGLRPLTCRSPHGRSDPIALLMPPAPRFVDRA